MAPNESAELDFFALQLSTRESSEYIQITLEYYTGHTNGIKDSVTSQ